MKKSDNNVLGQEAGADAAANDAIPRGIVINDESSHVPHYTTNVSNQIVMLEHLVFRSATYSTYLKDRF